MFWFTKDANWDYFAWLLRSPQWVRFHTPQEWYDAVRELRRMDKAR